MVVVSLPLSERTDVCFKEIPKGEGACEGGGDWGGPIHVSSIDVDFLVYSRITSAAVNFEHDPELDEQHWSYLDGFADGMTARGPTLGTDRETWTGSLHVVDLPSAEAVREFVAREPYN